METDTVTVWAVQPHPDPRGFTVWEIRTSGPVVTTLKDWAAALCQRALDRRQRVVVTWTREHWASKQGRLVSVALEQAA